MLATTLKKTRALAVSIMALAGTVAGAGIATAEPAKDTSQQSNESSDAMQQLMDGIEVPKISPANITIYIPPSGLSTDLTNPALPRVSGIHQFLSLGADKDNFALTLPYNALWTTGLMTYNESRTEGTLKAIAMIKAIHLACPQAKIHLYGYSEGADVGAHVVQMISHDNGPIPKESLGSAVFQGNPVRQTNGTHAAGSAQVPGEGLFNPVDYGDQSDKVMEVCNKHDVVCNTSYVAPNLYHWYSEAISRSAPLRGQVDITGLVTKFSPQILGKSAVELPHAAVGWFLHSTDYYLWTPQVRNQGEQFIRDHYAKP